VHKIRADFNQLQSTEKTPKNEHILKKSDLILPIFSIFNE